MSEQAALFLFHGFRKQALSIKTNAILDHVSPTFSAILDAAAEVCNLGENSTRMLEGSDIWVTVLSWTRTTAANRRKSIDPPAMNTPNPWKDCNKHTALWTRR